MINNEALDDPIVADGSDYFRGMVSRIKASRLEAVDAAYLENLDVTLEGTARTRPGRQQQGASLPAKIDGLGWYEVPGKSALISASGGDLYERESLGGADASIGTYSGGSPEIVQLVDKLYIADGIAVQMWDGNATIGNVAQAPQGATILVAHTFRLFAAGIGGEPDAVYVSDLLDGETWQTPQNVLRVGDGDGDPIVALISWQSFALLVFCRSSVWVINANPAQTPGDWTIQRVPGAVGALASHAVAPMGRDVFFLGSGNEVFTVQRNIEQNDVEVPVSLSAPVADVLRQMIDPGTARSVAWRQRVLIAYSTDGSVPDQVLVYNQQARAWSGIWTGWAPTAWQKVYFAGEERLLFGDDNGSIWEVRDDGITFTDGPSQGIASHLITKAYTFGQRILDKSLFNLEIETRGSRAQYEVNLLVDGENPLPVAADIDSGPDGPRLPIALPFQLLGTRSNVRAWGLQHVRPGREFQVEVKSDGSDIFNLRAVLLSAFLETLDAER